MLSLNGVESQSRSGRPDLTPVLTAFTDNQNHIALHSGPDNPKPVHTKPSNQANSHSANNLHFSNLVSSNDVASLPVQDIHISHLEWLASTRFDHHRRLPSTNAKANVTNQYFSTHQI
ncbi:hypothetical protein F511_42492 [Dorcoceras hygrometricum]|uniref:Uncharacterized protein n=1 Tax=Dorcoceras hygrometricum TaxID=472368 RepID=A0A2Z7AGA8_9LAMI|nr:hypothetical protein F511_42492 [Dorcoceras hygrometricum]